MKLSHVVERIAATTGVSKDIICRLKSTEDIKNWPIQPEAHSGVKRGCSVPENFDILVRQTEQDLFLEKKQMPSLKWVYAKLTGLKVRDIVHLNIFQGSELRHEDSNVLVWSQTT